MYILVFSNLTRTQSLFRNFEKEKTIRRSSGTGDLQVRRVYWETRGENSAADFLSSFSTCSAQFDHSTVPRYFSLSFFFVFFSEFLIATGYESIFGRYASLTCSCNVLVYHKNPGNEKHYTASFGIN